MILVRIFLGVFFLILISTLGAESKWDPEAVEKAKEAVKAFKEEDPSMKSFFGRSYGYAVFPSVGKGGIGIGGAHGNGTVFKGGKPVGKTSLTQATIGFQLGGQSYREIIFFEEKEDFDEFTAGKFKLAAQASAVAATSGASADAAYENGVAICTMAKGGLMYEASVGGQKFKYEAF